jgi:hypothetical protein
MSSKFHIVHIHIAFDAARQTKDNLPKALLETSTSFHSPLFGDDDLLGVKGGINSFFLEWGGIKFKFLDLQFLNLVGLNTRYVLHCANHYFLSGILFALFVFQYLNHIPQLSRKSSVLHPYSSTISSGVLH